MIIKWTFWTNDLFGYLDYEFKFLQSHDYDAFQNSFKPNVLKDLEDSDQVVKWKDSCIVSENFTYRDKIDVKV